jgi:hypothetical protein
MLFIRRAPEVSFAAPHGKVSLQLGACRLSGKIITHPNAFGYQLAWGPEETALYAAFRHIKVQILKRSALFKILCGGVRGVLAADSTKYPAHAIGHFMHAIRGTCFLLSVRGPDHGRENKNMNTKLHICSWLGLGSKLEITSKR